MNFLPMFAGMMQGQRDYQDWIQAKQAKQQQMEFEALRAQAMQQEMARQAQEQQRQQDIARGYIASIPQSPQAPAQQAPAPGQPSQPMQQQPQGLDVTKLSPQQIAFLSKKDPREFANGVQDFQQTSIPPYQSMNQAGAVPQQMPQIPEPPKYDWNTAVEKIKASGVTDPQAILAILDKQQSRLDVEAKQRLAFLKEQEAHDDRRFRMEETARHNRELESLGRQNADTNRQRADSYSVQVGRSGGQGQGSSSGDAVDAAAWDRIITGHEPPARGGVYQSVMKRVAEIAKENGMSTQELMSASADVKSRLAAKKNFEVRAQNMKRAENQLDAEIPVFEDMIEKVNAHSPPAFAKLELAARRQMGDPLVTQMDQAADVIFREFEGLITGNPGTLNVQDVQNAHQAYMSAQTPQQAKAAIAGMRRIIKNAQASMDKTRGEIMGDINKQVGRQGGAATSGPKVGEVQDGYRFKGGNPADPNSWEKM